MIFREPNFKFRKPNPAKREPNIAQREPDVAQRELRIVFVPERDTFNSVGRIPTDASDDHPTLKVSHGSRNVRPFQGRAVLWDGPSGFTRRYLICRLQRRKAQSRGEERKLRRGRIGLRNPKFCKNSMDCCGYSDNCRRGRESSGGYLFGCKHL